MQLGHGGHGPFSGEDFLKSPHGDDQRDVGLSITGHVRAAVGESGRVDGELEGTTGVASSNITNQDVVVLRFRFVFGLRFLHSFTSPEVGSSGTASITLTIIKASPNHVGYHSPYTSGAGGENMRALVTGGAGFIGSHLIDRLVARGDEVVVLDNLSSGHRSFIAEHLEAGNVELIEGDICSMEDVSTAMGKGIDTVFHLAANPDIRLGTRITDTDLKQGTIATYNILEAMRVAGVQRIAFASSSVVYGEGAPLPTPETHGPCMPISLYGASKQAGEGLVSSWVGTFGLQAWIFRFANVVGARGTHGVIFDFIHKLKNDPSRLEVLGNGLQEKSYMEVGDCVDAILHYMQHTNEPLNLCNLGSHDTASVRRIAEIVVEVTGCHDAVIEYTGGDRGWAGDIPKARLSIERMLESGFDVRMNSEAAIRHTAECLLEEIGLEE